MSHVAPHKWAMKVGDRERAHMMAHARECTRCARQRDRVTATTTSFTAIKQQQPPEVAWDTVRARVHWSVSTERREKQRAPERRWLPYAIGLAAVAGAATAFVATRGGGDATPVVAKLAPVVVPAHHETPRPMLPPSPIGGLVSRASGDVAIDGAKVDLFSTTLAAGSTLATVDGRVDVQFGEASAFALGPRSSLELRHFDAQLIELVVEGTVDVEVAARTAGQRFLVHAGGTVVEVRGTQFRVQHDAAGTTVACRHGLVAVSDGSGLVEVGAQKRVAIAANRTVRDEAAQRMSKEELDRLVEATPLALPLWSDTLAQSSSSLEIATANRRAARVDGVELGAAPVRVRVMFGRHTVETADASGRYRRAGWVDVAANKLARVDVPAETRPSDNIAARKAQLQSGLDRTALVRCTRAIAKQGLSNTFVELELSVDPSGAVSFLNVIDTDLPSATASCVHDVVANVRFGAGPSATWREKLAL